MARSAEECEMELHHRHSGLETFGDWWWSPRSGLRKPRDGANKEENSCLLFIRHLFLHLFWKQFLWTTFVCTDRHHEHFLDLPFHGSSISKPKTKSQRLLVLRRSKGKAPGQLWDEYPAMNVNFLNFCSTHFSPHFLLCSPPGGWCWRGAAGEELRSATWGTWNTLIIFAHIPVESYPVAPFEQPWYFGYFGLWLLEIQLCFWLYDRCCNVQKKKQRQ